MEISKTVSILAALAQENRLAIYRYLVQAGPAGVVAGGIGLGLPAATLSFHLKTLKQAGLIVVERDGRHLIYRANYPVMNDLIAYLTDNCCNGGQCEVNPTPCIVSVQPPRPVGD